MTANASIEEIPIDRIMSNIQAVSMTELNSTICLYERFPSSVTLAIPGSITKLLTVNRLPLSVSLGTLL
jgi:hypothetical protein